ncbi:hypothetical protein, partial [Jeotgalibaca porci]|uniref:hypothetical protein n=1 Tax=Jeotgalibaca porci TaxID=1868793 RepID=UPI00359FBB85
YQGLFFLDMTVFSNLVSYFPVELAVNGFTISCRSVFLVEFVVNSFIINWLTDFLNQLLII